MKRMPLMVWVLLIGLLGSVYAQRATAPPGPRLYLETGTTASMELFFAQETFFGMQLGFQGGVKGLAGPFGVGGDISLELMASLESLREHEPSILQVIQKGLRETPHSAPPLLQQVKRVSSMRPMRSSL
ncbi:hypothetical protein, partial [Thermus sp.]|uniref:hypothetical protein n=1 Tax=Thermus sp. TaxID=275 RepID=UPI0026321C72